ncbi:hypothetical protein [Pseudomonas sp. IT-P294]
MDMLFLNWSHHLPFLTRRSGDSYVRSEKPVKSQPGQTEVCPHTAAIEHY